MTRPRTSIVFGLRLIPQLPSTTWLYDDDVLSTDGVRDCSVGRQMKAVMKHERTDGRTYMENDDNEYCVPHSIMHHSAAYSDKRA